MADNDFDSNPQGNGDGSTSDEFSIPEEYADRGWTKFFDGHTGEDLKAELFKSYDNSQTLIGKRVEDYIKSFDLKSLDNYDEVKEALTKQIAPEYDVPENVEGYSLNDILKSEDGTLEYEYPKETLDYFGNAFKELKLTQEQGQGLLKAFNEFELEAFKKHTDATELENSLKTMFNETGEKSEKRKTVESLLKEFLPEADQQFLQTSATNNTIEMFYKVAKGLIDKYGYKEGTQNSGNTSNFRRSKADIDAEYDRLSKKLSELDNRPQKVGERDAIIKEMRELFK